MLARCKRVAFVFPSYSHGVVVMDDYQWLEEAGAPAMQEWTRRENQRTRTYFTRLLFRDGIAQQLTQLRGEESARYSDLQERHGRIFALRFKPPAQQPVLVRLSSLEAPALWRTVFDPNAYNTNGTTAIDWYVPSPDGRVVAITLSEGGSEQGTLHFFEVESGRKLADEIPRVQYPTHRDKSRYVIVVNKDAYKYVYFSPRLRTPPKRIWHVSSYTDNWRVLKASSAGWRPVRGGC